MYYILILYYFSIMFDVLHEKCRLEIVDRIQTNVISIL
jgi:hypothetical protein